MKQLVWLFKWLLKAAIFFTLFAFALNNQGDVTVRFFFGTGWTAPMVLVVLASFAAGLAVGVVSMVPRWWRQRSAAQHAKNQRALQQEASPANSDKSTTPPPHGL